MWAISCDSYHMAEIDLRNFYFLKLPSDSDDFELEADQSQLNCYDYLELVIFSTNQTTEICGNSYDQEFGSKHILDSDWMFVRANERPLF